MLYKKIKLASLPLEQEAIKLGTLYKTTFISINFPYVFFPFDQITELNCDFKIPSTDNQNRLL